MRFRGTMLVVGLLALVTLGLAGCSDDETPTTPVDPGIDNTQYPIVKAEFGNNLDTTVTVIQKGIELAANTGTGGVDDLGEILFGPMLVDSQVNQNTWHVLFGSTIAAGISRTVIDSVQYSNNGVPQTNAQGANEITLRHTLIVTTEDQSGNFRNVESHTTLEFTALDGTTPVINGSHDAAITTQIVLGDVTTSREWTITTEITDVNVDRSSGCPTSGTVTSSVDLSQVVNDGTPAATSWQFDVTFDNGTAAITVTLGDQTASYHRSVCQM